MRQRIEREWRQRAGEEDQERGLGERERERETDRQKERVCLCQRYTKFVFGERRINSSIIIKVNGLSVFCNASHCTQVAVQYDALQKTLRAASAPSSYIV